MDYAAAKSTICRQCAAHFSPSAPKLEVKLRSRPEPQPAVAESNFLRKFEGLWAKQTNSVVECFECKAKQDVISAASSTTCPKCSSHLDLRDYKITTAFSRTIRTHGEVHLTAKGDLNSSSVMCRSALIEGKLRGNLHCAGTATINFSGKIPGRLTAEHVLIERKADVQFFRRVRAKSIEIRGRMSGEIIAETVVVIHRNASLDGNITAKSISVEKGGMFFGQLNIGGSRLTQGELLPQTNAASSSPREQSGSGDLLATPLPAA